MEKIVEIVDSAKIEKYDMIRAYFGDKKVCMFDIETTGLSPFKSFTYIIGINVFEDGKWKIIQLFNDDGKSEPEMIRVFQSIIKEYDVMVEFNGDTFDIPYIQKRMDFIENKFHIHLTDNFRSIESYDLMKMVRQYKFALGLPNIKQKTVEKYIGINRVDMYNGGQLIDVYLGYLAMKDMRSRELVLRHNRDDMEGMILISCMLAIDFISRGLFHYKKLYTEVSPNTEKMRLCFDIQFDMALVRPLITYAYGIEIRGEGNLATIKVPVESGSYNFYLGKLEKDGCVEKEGPFVPQMDCEVKGLPAYKLRCRDKESFLLLDDTFLGNEAYICEYISNVGGKVLKYKKNR